MKAVIFEGVCADSLSTSSRVGQALCIYGLEVLYPGTCNLIPSCEQYNMYHLAGSSMLEWFNQTSGTTIYLSIDTDSSLADTQLLATVPLISCATKPLIDQGTEGSMVGSQANVELDGVN